MLPDVVKVALARHKTTTRLLQRYSHFVEHETRKATRAQGIFGFQSDSNTPIFSILEYKRHRPPFLPNTEDISGYESVLRAFYSNVAIASFKGFVFFNTGSSAVFADLAHSGADVMNYGYRLLTVRWSTHRPADSIHPYGYSRLRDVCADRSFSVLLFVGGVIPLVHVFTEAVAMAPTPFPGLQLSMFFVSAWLEMIACRAGYKEVSSLAVRSGVSSTEYVRHGSDMMPVATFLEAITGVAGALIGSVGVLMSFYTGSVYWDVAASSLMATSVVVVSSRLLMKSQAALVGRTLPVETVSRILGMLESHTSVVAVHDVKTEVSGAETVRFKAEIEFNAEEITKRRLAVNGAHVFTHMMTQLGTLKSPTDVEDWLMRNDSKFLFALTSELKDLEGIIRRDLREKHTFVNIHIDLEPW